MDTSTPTVIEKVPAPKVLLGKERQRRTPEEKRNIVQETLAPEASVARVARAHGVNANQVFQWRRLYHAGKLDKPITAVARLLPVSVSEPNAAEAPLVPTLAASTSCASTGEPSTGPARGTIHLELRKARVRIEGNADPAVLRLVLKALLG